MGREAAERTLPVISTEAEQPALSEAEGSGEIRPATEAGQALKPWASTVRVPDSSTTPRIKSGAPVGMTGWERSAVAGKAPAGGAAARAG